MVKRRGSKNKSGSNGYGSSKKNRGAGSRGGRGKAGSGKKAQSKNMKKDGVNKLGEEGFNSRKDPQNGINLRDIDEKIESFVSQGLAEENEDGFVFDADEAGYDKILGSGQIRKHVEIRAKKFSDSAESKIEESDATAVKLEE